jgi:hypothetical protein
MKKSILFFAFSSAAHLVFSQTQIGNSDFESWETSTSELAEPTNWNSFKTGSGTWSSFGGQQLDKSTSVRPGSIGSYSARIFSRDAGFGIVANGNMTLGKIEMGSTNASSSSNYNYTIANNANFSEAFTDSPDSLVVWVKYTPVSSSGNNARISAVIHNNTDGYKDPNDVAGSNTVATAIYNFPSIGGWERIAIPFTYVGTPSNAAFIIVTFTSNSTPGGGSVNDELLVDDLQLIYNPSGAGVNELNSQKFKVFAGQDQIKVFGQISENASYAIYSLNGGLIQSGDLKTVIPFDRPIGTYFLQIEDGNATQRIKFVKD